MNQTTTSDGTSSRYHHSVGKAAKNKQVKKNALYDTAFHLFTSKGIAHTSISDIAEGAQVYVIDDAELQRVKDNYPVIWKKPDAKPELCFVGCPHMSLQQLKDWSRAVQEGLEKNGRRKVAVPTVFTAPMPVIKEFEQTMDAYYLKQSGVVLSYICPLMYMNNPLCKKKAVITSSNKLRTYTSARYYTEAEILQIITGGAK